ncbi:MAG: hypothetical protein ACN4GT_11600 [Gammaproteobacteria bacterium]
MARRSPQSHAKRERELAKAKKRQDKIARREQRKADREQGADTPADEAPSVEPNDTQADDQRPS